jgi:hypothetical protein
MAFLEKDFKRIFQKMLKILNKINYKLIGFEFTPIGTSKTSFRTRALIGKEFTSIGTGKPSFRSLAPIGTKFSPIGTGKTSFRSLAPVG